MDPLDFSLPDSCHNEPYTLSLIHIYERPPKQITVSLGISKRFCVEDLEEFYEGIKLEMCIRDRGTYRQTVTQRKGKESLIEWIPEIPESGNYAVYALSLIHIWDVLFCRIRESSSQCLYLGSR